MKECTLHVHVQYVPQSNLAAPVYSNLSGSLLQFRRDDPSIMLGGIITETFEHYAGVHNTMPGAYVVHMCKCPAS